VCCVGINIYIFVEHLAIYMCVRESVCIYVVCVYMCTSCIEEESCYSGRQREREIHAHTHIHAKTHKLRRGTSIGWLRMIGSLNLYVSFAEYCLLYRALLRQRPIILRSLLIVATTYTERQRSRGIYSCVYKKHAYMQTCKHANIHTCNTSEEVWGGFG